MNRTPNLTMLKPATEYAEKVARQIDVKAYMSKGNGMYMGIYDAWSAIAENLFENMDIPMSASGTITDIIECLAPQKRKMTVKTTQDACCIEYSSRSDMVRIESHGEGGMIMAFQPNLPYWAYDPTDGPAIPVETMFDISTYGPDSVAAVIAALFRSHRILLDRFRKYVYR